MLQKVIISLRVSSAGQVDNTSLDTQEQTCRDYAERQDLEVVEVYRWEADSACYAG